MSSRPDIERAKESAALAALELVESGMTLGLGTGSTAKYFISHLGNKCRNGLQIKAVATSEQSHRLAESEGIPLIDINSISSIDLDIDGADEIDPQKRLIKGGGGAALREKIIAAMSRDFIVIADEGKLVDHLGKFPLAVEILPFGYPATIKRLEQMGYKGTLRAAGDGSMQITDCGNFIYDLNLAYPCLSPEDEDARIRAVLGVVETGFFLGMTTKALIGRKNGQVEVIE